MAVNLEFTTVRSNDGMMHSVDEDIRLGLGLFFTDEEIRILRRKAKRPFPGLSVVDGVKAYTKQLGRRNNK